VTQQEMIDWAFAQKLDDVEEKLVLIGLALNAGPRGGGFISCGELARSTSLSVAQIDQVLFKLKCVGAATKFDCPGHYGGGLSATAMIAYKLAIPEK